MAEREGIEFRPQTLMPIPAIPVQCNPSLLRALQFAPAERTSTVHAASAQITANERIGNNPARYVHRGSILNVVQFWACVVNYVTWTKLCNT